MHALHFAEQHVHSPAVQVAGAFAAASDVPAAFPAYIPPPAGLFVGQSQQRNQQRAHGQQGNNDRAGGGEGTSGQTRCGGPMEDAGESEEEEEAVQAAMAEYQR